MVINLFNNTSEINKINKTLDLIATLEGSLKEPSSITEPVITIEYEHPSLFNYAQIPEFNRYYFVNDVVCVHKNILKISLISDPIMSFSGSILNSSVILSDSSITGASNYLPGDVWKTSVKELTDIVNFPSGLLDTGQFILITAGG